MRGRLGYLPVAGVVAATALVAAGCGGDDSAPIVTVQGASGASGAGHTAALSQPAYIRQADATCDEANAALASLESGTAADPKIQATQEVQIRRSELDSLRSLTPPDQDRATLRRFLSALQSEVEALMRKRDAVNQGGDASSADAEASNAEADAVAAADAYGLTDCARGGQAPTSEAAGTTTAPTTTVPTTPAPATTPAPIAPAPAAPAPPSGGTGGGTAGGGTGGDTGGGTGGGTGGTGGSGGVSP